MVMPEVAIRRSVQDVPTVDNADNAMAAYGTGDLLGGLSMFTIAEFANEIIPWGLVPKLRDIQLREFMTTESLLMSALSMVASRNASFSWRFDGGPRQVSKAQDILQHANAIKGGTGWRNFVVAFTLDLLTQDNGAFVEIIREADRPTAPCVGIAMMDAGRCWATGDPLNPVLYSDIMGKRHLMPYYSVMRITEMPSNIERLRGLQYSAMSRILKSAQIFRDIQQYTSEKMGGRRPGSIHFVSGVSAQALSDALLKAKAQADNQTLYRYMEPLVVEGLKPGEPVTTATIDLANLPDKFDFREAWEQYVNGLALALLVDRQDIAPLGGGNIGTSTQSEVLARKTRGKGPALFMKLLEDAFNFYGIFGEGVTFSFDEQDLQMELEQATIGKTQADAGAVLVNAGILTPAIVRQQMVDRGELEPEYLKMVSEGDLTDETTGTDLAPTDAAPEIAVTVAEAGVPQQPAAVAAVTAANPLAQIAAPKAMRKDPQHEAMDATESAARERYTAALAKSRAAFRKAVEGMVR